MKQVKGWRQGTNDGGRTDGIGKYVQRNGNCRFEAGNKGHGKNEEMMSFASGRNGSIA